MLAQRRFLVTTLSAAILLAGACGDGDGDGDGVAPVVPPPAGESSAQYGVPLPRGAVAAPDASRPGAEIYRLPDTTVAEAEAFYARETDNKSLHDFEWCGKVVTGRIWHRPSANPGTEEVLEIVLDDTAGPDTTVTATFRESPPLTCPPEPPEGSSG